MIDFWQGRRIKMADPETVDLIPSTSVGPSQNAMLTKNSQPEHLVVAQFVAPSSLSLKFADGLTGTWSFDELRLDMSGMKPETAKASGKSVEVQDEDGDV